MVGLMLTDIKYHFLELFVKISQKLMIFYLQYGIIFI